MTLGIWRTFFQRSFLWQTTVKLVTFNDWLEAGLVLAESDKKHGLVSFMSQVDYQQLRQQKKNICNKTFQD